MAMSKPSVHLLEIMKKLAQEMSGCRPIVEKGYLSLIGIEIAMSLMAIPSTVLYYGLKLEIGMKKI